MNSLDLQKCKKSKKSKAPEEENLQDQVADFMCFFDCIETYKTLVY